MSEVVLESDSNQVEGDEVEDISLLSPGLAKIRKRRWLLWSVLIVYLPTMWITQKITHSFNDSLPVFFIWFLVLIAVMGISAVVKCPRCKNYFHVNGMTLLYLRNCLHCQLHLSADKKALKERQRSA
ncbi:MAG: hypothetical protein A2075_19395 [Geobacteraceae bacterium GWC2_58_44]|nr:MAG: hypothetical protein A2075_19395 [Geobacteraceae bacterium GWC2_58_44]